MSDRSVSGVEPESRTGALRALTCERHADEAVRWCEPQARTAETRRSPPRPEERNKYDPLVLSHHPLTFSSHWGLTEKCREGLPDNAVIGTKKKKKTILSRVTERDDLEEIFKMNGGIFNRL